MAIEWPMRHRITWENKRVWSWYGLPGRHLDLLDFELCHCLHKGLWSTGWTVVYILCFNQLLIVLTFSFSGLHSAEAQPRLTIFSSIVLKAVLFCFWYLGRSTPGSVLRNPCGAGDWTPALASITCTPVLWVAFLILCLFFYTEISDTEVYLECKVQNDNGVKQMSSFKHVTLAGNLCSCTENRARCPNQWQNQNLVLWFVC